jgi:hypothetical protein
MTTEAGARRYRVTASFDSPELAQDAMLGLEAAGIDAHDIHLRTADAVQTPEGERRTDLRIAGSIARRYGAGAVIGAAVGALLVFAVLAIAGFSAAQAAVIGALAGGTGGFFLGGYWGVARRLPVNAEAFDTMAVDTADDRDVTVEVEVIDDADTLSTVNDTLRRAGARVVRGA